MLVISCDDVRGYSTLLSCVLFVFRVSADSLHLPSPSSPHLAKESNLIKRPPSPAHAPSPQTNGFQSRPASTHGPIEGQNLSLSTTGFAQGPTHNEKEKKLKRRHSEVEQDAPEASATEEPKSSVEKRKKKKKRKREETVNHLEADSVKCHQEADWCIGQTWSLGSAVKESTEGYHNKHQSRSPAGVPVIDPVLKKKKKLKHKLVAFRNGAALSKWSVNIVLPASY